MSLALLDTQLGALLLNCRRPSSAKSPTNNLNLRILQHFQAVTSRSIGSPTFQRLLHDNVSKRVWDHPYLMHITLAVSAAHIRRLGVDSSTACASKRLLVLEAQHWQEALLLHRKELAQPDCTYDAQYDARVETTFLAIIYLFALDDVLPINAFSAGTSDLLMRAISPLAVCSGFRALRITAGPRVYTSSWLPVLVATDDAHGTFSSEAPGTQGIPSAFIQLCGLDASSTAENNDYHRILRLLTPILRLEPDVNNFAKLFSFAGRGWLNLKPLLLRKDHRALLLVSYWFALLHQIDQWWLTVRAKTECQAIVEYLSQSSEDVNLHRLLEYPATFGHSGLSTIWRAM